MKNFQSQSSPIITFPQLQSIRFVQTSFHSDQNTTPTLNSTSPISAQLQNQQTANSQVNMIRTQEEVAQLNAQNNNTRNVRNNVTQNQVPNAIPATIGVQPQSRTQNTIVIQHPTTVPAQPRQVVATIQQQQQYPGATVAVSSRSSRSSNQGSQRGSRNSNKEPGGGRSRSSTKEPPGAVNLERSYQICQAVIREILLRVTLHTPGGIIVEFWNTINLLFIVAGHTKFSEQRSIKSSFKASA